MGIKYKPWGKNVLVCVAITGTPYKSKLIIPANGSSLVNTGCFAVGQVVAIGDNVPTSKLKVGHWVEFDQHFQLARRCVLNDLIGAGHPYEDNWTILIDLDEVKAVLTFDEGDAPQLMPRKQG